MIDVNNKLLEWREFYGNMMPRDRELLEKFHQLSDIKQKACLAHMKLDVELELEFRDKE